MRIAVYPGSFDPLTVGHMDIIRRSAALFDKLYVAVLHNPAKSGLIPPHERVNMIAKACHDIPNVEADLWDGMLVDYAVKINACAVIRGLRGIQDLSSEQPMAELNKRLSDGLETIFLLSSPEHSCISSSAVREIGSWGRDISPFVPDAIADDIRAFFPALN